MHIDYLVKMANDIGQFFAVYPDTPETEQEIAGHLQRFWSPDMRATLQAHVAQGGAGLQPLVARAVLRLQRPAATAQDDPSPAVG